MKYHQVFRFVKKTNATILSAIMIFISVHTKAQTVYWLESQTNLIKKITYSGSPVNASGATTVAAASVPVYSFYDKATNEIYWCDNLAGAIKKVASTGGTITTVVNISGGAGVLEGFYVDDTHHFAYWGEKGTGATDKLRRIDISGALPKSSGSATDLVTGIDIIRGIAVDTGSNFIYFADAGFNAQGKGIYRVNYTGTTIPDASATKIAATPVSGSVVPQPQQLFLDRSNKFIYWADYAKNANNIKRVSTATGTVYPATPVTVYAGASVRGIYINALENNIYWTEPKSLLIQKASLASLPITTGTVVVNNLSGLPRNLIYFALDLVVPVTFISAHAYPSGKEVKIDWTVNAEIDMDHYTVEQSKDGIHFTELGNVMPAAMQGPVNNYSLTDHNPVYGDNYYRIKAVSLNGRLQYTPVMKVNISGQKIKDIGIYPNPVAAGDPVNIDLQNLDAGLYEISLFNKAGQLMYRQKYSHNGGSSFIAINLQKPAAGTYILFVKSSSASYSKEFLLR